MENIILRDVQYDLEAKRTCDEWKPTERGDVVQHGVFEISTP